MTVLKPYSFAGLQRAAEYYLARYASSSANLRRVLERKIQRRGTQATSEEETAQWLDTIIGVFQQSGALHDTSYAEARTRSLRRKGTSRQGIVRHLQQKGIDREDISTVLEEEEDPESAEEEAARAYLKRTRRGIFRTAPTTPEQHQKDRQALARMGFSHRTAMAVLQTVDEDA